MNKIITLIGLILICVSVNATTVTYSEFSEKTVYNNGRVKLVSGVSNLQDMEGNWKPFFQAVNVNYNDYALRFSYNQYWVEYKPYVIRNGNKYTLEWIINNFDNVKDHIDFNANRDYYKWSLTITGIPENLKEGVTAIGFDYKDSNNLSWADIQVDGNFIIIKNKIALSIQDLRHHNLTVDMNKETFVISNLDSSYDYHGETRYHWNIDENGLWELTLDPTFIKYTQQSSDDASNNNLGVYDDNDNTYYIASTLYTGFTDGIIFQDVNITQGTTVSEALLTICVFDSCGGAVPSECATRIWGFNTDDANTWASGVNEPEDALKTTAFVDRNSMGSDTSNGVCTERDLNVTNIVNEILQREGLGQPDTNYGFLIEDNGSRAPPRQNVQSIFYTYDSGAALSKLTIEWILLIDYSFSFSYPASGCSNGKGCLGAGCSACTYAYFEPTDLTGVSTETEVDPYGQTSTLAFIVVDNQSSSSSDFNMSIDLNENAPSEAGWFIKLKLSTITGGWESTCSENALTGCILVDDSNKNIGTINYSASTQDKNLFFWSDFQSVNISSYDRNGTFYSYGT